MLKHKTGIAWRCYLNHVYRVILILAKLVISAVAMHILIICSILVVTKSRRSMNFHVILLITMASQFDGYVLANPFRNLAIKKCKLISFKSICNLDLDKSMVFIKIHLYF